MEGRLISMLDDLNELKTFRAILEHGSLSAAGRALDVSLAVVSKRLHALERRAGVRLLHRSTRSSAPTEEGIRLARDVERALDSIAAAEASLVSGREAPFGTLRVSAPISFGRRHVAPVLAYLTVRHDHLSVELELTDRVSDLIGEALDAVIRIGEVPDSSVMMRKLADNRRILVAAPAYLDRVGRPRTPAEAESLHFLRYQSTGASLRLTGRHGETVTIRSLGRMRVDSGDAAHDWALAGHGILVKSEVDVAAELASKQFERVLPKWHAGAAPIVALYPSGKHLPPKTRAFIDAMAAHFESPVAKAAGDRNGTRAR
jgi:DNA-binding transcriptional LysR family regulator